MPSNDGDDILTVYDDDNLSISGFSDLRSQRSGRAAHRERQGVDLYQNIIEEEEDEDGLDVSEDHNRNNEGGAPSAENQNEGGGNPDESVA